MAETEYGRRIGDVEKDTRSIYQAINELTVEIRLLAQSHETTQSSLNRTNQLIEQHHEHDKRLQAVESKVEAIRSALDVVDDLDKRITSNEAVTGVAKWLTAGIVLAVVGVLANQLAG